ncbi:hypothetical protein ACFFWC_04125 [Plantactinospora siamensis]|uniref:Uncharacterized protein n=1 Tax=Plantactinospora siamensis TaxID=555372 RepID=A0ABV6NSV9_9ACTN
MYRWIWRHLPFGLPGKLAGSVLLSAAVVLLLWFVVFPWAEPLLPFDDVQVTQQGETPGEAPVTRPAPGATPTGDDYDLPYATHTNNRPPSGQPLPS